MIRQKLIKSVYTSDYLQFTSQYDTLTSDVILALGAFYARKFVMHELGSVSAGTTIALQTY